MKKIHVKLDEKTILHRQAVAVKICLAHCPSATGLLDALCVYPVQSPYIFKLETGATLEEKAAAARMLLELQKCLAGDWPGGDHISALPASIVTQQDCRARLSLQEGHDEVCAGNLDISFKLRRRDDLKDLAESLNMVIAELRTCVTLCRRTRPAEPRALPNSRP